MGFLSFAFLYALTVYAGVALQEITGSASSIWLASGAAVGILLLQEKGSRRAFIFMFFIVNLWGEWRGGCALWSALAFSLLDALEAAFCVWLIEKFKKAPIHFKRAQDILALLSGTLLSNGLFSILEALAAQAARPLQAWGINFAADALGMLLIAPTIALWRQDSRVENSARHFAEYFLHLALSVLFAALLFGPFTQAESPVLRNYMVFPLIIWAAFRFSAHGMSSSTLIFALIAIWNTSQGNGIFSAAGQSAEQRISALQIYLSVVAFSGLLLNAVVKERKEAEKSLRLSEEKYRTVANFTYNWEAWRDPQGEYQYISPSCQRMTGYTSEEFTSNPNLILEITHPSDLYKTREHFSKASHETQKELPSFDFRIITKSGELRWINHACASVHSQTGVWLGRRESNRDVTIRKRTEEVLRSRLWLSRFADHHSTQELMQSALNEAEALTASEIGFFHLIDEDQENVMLQMWSSNTLLNMCGVENQPLHYPLESAGIWADCAREKRTVIYNNYSESPNRKGLPIGHAPVRSILTVPVIRGGKVAAIFGVGNKKTGYDELDEKTVSQLADLTWDIVQRKNSEGELRLAKEELEKLNASLQLALTREEELAHTDSLTGICNRRHLFQLAQREFELAERHRLPLSIILFDVDHFKKFNDNYGHDIGDEVLIQAVRCARAQLRSGDIFGRYGGEEFVAALPMTNLQHAAQVAERIRFAIESLRVPTVKGDLHITVSVGVAQMNDSQRNGSKQTLDMLVHNADEAMYASKQAGRNRVTLFNAIQAK
ncbi:MAG: hypothetical protein Fur002_00970 [Anaerolineales bacterium]